MARGARKVRRDQDNDERVAVTAYRHTGASRKNNPPAAIAAEGFTPYVRQLRYSYSPRRPPELRFDQNGTADQLPELLAHARQRPLTDEEIRLLAEALRVHQPWLEWAGKREAEGFTVEPVALHIHERVSAQALLKVATRQDVTRDLFADPAQAYREAVQFYQHDVDWANRLILGDSLQVMASLARREDLAGKVQMIYMDPPYGIRFGSNFQPEIGRKDVKEREIDITREPEMVKAYRDTWTLGIHSYLTYFRNRLTRCRELLADTGSLFVQISDENQHYIRAVLDETFGPQNFCSLISFAKARGTTSAMLPSPTDYLLWYAKNKELTKYRPLFLPKQLGGAGGGEYSKVLLSDGTKRGLREEEISDAELLPPGSRIYRLDNLVSQGFRQFTSVPFEVDGKTYDPGHNMNWKTTLDGL